MSDLTASIKTLVQERGALYEEEHELRQLYLKAFEQDTRLKEIRKRQYELQTMILARLGSAL